MAEYELKIAKEEDKDTWNHVVKTAPHASIFHTWDWLKIVERHTQLHLYPIIGLKGSSLIGIYPIFQEKKYGFKQTFSPPPGAAIPYLGPILLEDETLRQSKKETFYKEFQKKVDTFIFEELDSNYAFISLVPAYDPRPFKWTGYRLDPIFDYQLDLSSGEETVWKNFDENLRSHIRRSKKNGANVDDGSLNDLEWIFDALRRRYREQNRHLRVKLDYLREVYRNFFPDHLRLFVAKSENEVLGGIFTLVWQGKMSYWVGGAKNAVKGISPNDLAQWEAIQWGIRNDIRLYEEIGAGTERLAIFKAKYNPSLSVRFNATKYSSTSSYLMELAYKRILKRAYGHIHRG